MNFRKLLESFKVPVIKQRGFGSLILTDTLLNELKKFDKIEVLRVVDLPKFKKTTSELKKSNLSSFTKAKDNVLKGQQTNGGILLKLFGVPIIKSNNDFESDVDNKNVKYIPIRAFSMWKNGNKIQKLLQKYTNDYYTKALTLLGKPQNANWAIKELINQDHLGMNHAMIQDMTDDIKKELIEYTDILMDKLIKDNLELIVNVLQDTSLPTQESMFDWNEIAISNAIVKEVYLINDILSINNLNQAKEVCKNLKYKCKVIKSTDLQKIIKGLKK